MTGIMKIGRYRFDLTKQTYVMGILNMTPDSFSDGGSFNETDKAMEHVAKMIEEGADIIDIGGESTRPGYTQVSEQDEIERVVPVIRAIKEKYDIPVSIDTYKSKVAAAALDAGADMVNDIWGLKYDSDMARVIKEKNASVCIMHNRKKCEYDNFMEDVLADLYASCEIARKAGIPKERIMLDPGIGFAKTYEMNLECLHHLERFLEPGYPVLLGTSRKSVIGLTLDEPVTEREEGTLATTVLAVMKGISFVRVHDVQKNRRAIQMTIAMRDVVLMETGNQGIGDTKSIRTDVCSVESNQNEVQMIENQYVSMMAQNDCIKIKDLELYCNHGVLKEENVLGQKFLVSAVLYQDTRKAGQSDNLSYSVNYADVAHVIKHFMEEHTFQLIEAAAEQLAEKILIQYPTISKIQLEIKKPWAPVLLPLDTVSVEIEREWHTAFIALGSSMGDKRHYISKAVELLQEQEKIQVVTVSPLYETTPMGDVVQDNYVNGVVMIKTLLEPQELLQTTSEIENQLGRVREVHWGPRTLDLDILFYDNLVWKTDTLMIPHPGIPKRDFVLKPMMELAPAYMHPLLGKNMYQLYQELDEFYIVNE